MRACITKLAAVTQHTQALVELSQTLRLQIVTLITHVTQARVFELEQKENWKLYVCVVQLVEGSPASEWCKDRFTLDKRATQSTHARSCLTCSSRSSSTCCPCSDRCGVNESNNE